MNTDWQEYWKILLEENKLQSLVDQMDEIDQPRGKTENICYEIYNSYSQKKTELDEIRDSLIKMIEDLKGVHLHTSRVKMMDSLLRKVIEKRHEQLMDKRTPYSRIDGGNYQDIVGDLIGIRIIVSYRGDWKELHHQIIKIFPYVNQDQYKLRHLIPHEEGKQFLAEIPIAYYAENDDLSIFQEENVKCKLHEMGYRSVHYVLSYQNTYVELQLRTIYDEAWSDCDHRYVYKKNENASYAALTEISKALNLFTNTANDLGEEMREIFENDSIVDGGSDSYKASQAEINRLSEVLDRLNVAVEKYSGFISKLRVKEGEEDD